MIERRGRRLAVVAALAAGGTLALAGPAAADPAGVVSQPLAQAPEETLDHWTPERVREAVAAGPPAAPGGSVDPPARTSAIPPDAETDPALDTIYPQRVHGLLLVEIAGQGASCSATVVSSREEDVIVTAGHCLLVPGEVSGGAGIVFAESVAFIPGYRNPGTGATPAEPFGRFAGVRLGTPRAFAQTGDISFDFGVVKLAPGAAGKIETAIGSRGIAFNRKSKSFRGDVFEINGYPARPPPEYDPTRRRMILCVSSFQGFERSTGAPVVGPCNQQEGSSGAGWVRKRRVESLTSHAGCASPAGCSLISGSYFGDEEFNVYRELGGVATGKRKKLKRCKKKPSKSKRTGCRRKLQRFSPTGA